MEPKNTDQATTRHERLDAVRTKLANERTVLSYVRTALALFVAGITFIRFFDNLVIEIIGWIFIPIGLVNMGLGMIRYRKTRRHIDEMD